MKHMKTIVMLLISLTLVFVATAMVSAQDDYYDDWSYEGDPTAPWAALGLFTGVMCIIPIVMIILGIVLAIWVYKDAEKRDSSGALWLIIVLITGILGLIIWLVVRPPIGGKKAETTAAQSSDRRCPSCGRSIPDDARVCPYCGKNFEG
ncbi:MAG: hypothetical protein DRN27_03780 [Thermoplasmata archaeon]|nr:MAG: hypothetical protein DRN27_03780 [Thermoplasmata archaeon]